MVAIAPKSSVVSSVPSSRVAPATIEALTPIAVSGVKAMFPNASDIRVNPRFGEVYGQPTTTVTARVGDREVSMHFSAMGPGGAKANLSRSTVRLSVYNARAGDPHAVLRKDGGWGVIREAITPESQRSALKSLKDGAIFSVGQPDNFITGSEMTAMVEAAKHENGALTPTGRAFLEDLKRGSRGSYLDDSFDMATVKIDERKGAKATLSLSAWLELRKALS